MKEEHLPLAGAALRLERFAEFKDWILEDQRDLEIQDPCVDFPMGQWRERAKAWKRELSEFRGRLGVHGPYDGVAIASRDPDARKYAQNKLLDCLDFCETIGATQCVAHSPFHFLGSSVACHTSTFALDYMIANAGETLAPVLERAATANCDLVLENIFDRNTAPLRALMQSIGHPRLKRSVDTGHALIAERCGGPSPEFWVMEAKSDLAHIHLQDTNGENDYHWTPGLGNVNWPGVFQAIAKMEEPPRLIMEVKDLGAAWKFFKQQGLVR